MATDPMNNALVLITGATDGIGKETARALLRAGARVLLHGRDRGKAETVERELRQDTGSDATSVLLADFRSLAQVRHLAEEVRNRFPDLRVLVNNAGVYTPTHRETEDGFEQTFQVQYIAPFVLTLALLDRLWANTPARVVNVTSILHRGAELDFGYLQSESRYEGHAAYATSKLALTMFTLELAERLRGTGVTANCVHPGGVDTKLKRKGYGSGGLSPEEGAEPVVHLASSSELEGVTGRYFERLVESVPDPRAEDAKLRAWLWQETEGMLEVMGKKAA